MSELTNVRSERSDIRRRLLTTVCATALLVCVSASHEAKADDAPFWIELGGTFSHLEDTQDAYLPPFAVATPRPPFAQVSPAEVQKVSPASWDGSAKISFEPTGTDLVFSAGVLYGKANRARSLIQQTVQPYGGAFSDVYPASQIVTSKNNASHAVADFRAGKDIGLGMLGMRGSSLISLGVRYAQFQSQSSATIRSQPTNLADGLAYNRFYATFAETRKFTGVGPSLSWDASAGLVGDPASGEIALDWGASAAVLFGRQTVRGHHQTTDNYFHHFYRYLAYHHTGSPNRSKQASVPNVGGFAALSWRYPNAKVSVGYRADFFFGAMDGGVDAARKEHVGFYGPFATVSVGLGG
jgi:hypothetical protein